MGYNYYILVQVKNDEPWINMDYFASSGSYGLTDNHYFMSHLFEHQEYTENVDESLALLHEMGEYQHVFSYETIKNDYLRYSVDPALLNIKAQIDNMLHTNITRETLQQINSTITKFLESDIDLEECKTAYSELDKYYKLCEKYRAEYRKVRVIFGYDP